MLSHFSRVQLFETLWTVAYQAPLSIEFSRQENCSGLPWFPPGDLSHPGVKPTSSVTPAFQADSLPLSHCEILCVCVCVCVCVVSDSLWPHGLYSPWNSPGQNTAVDNRSLLQGIFPTQGSNPGLPHYRQILQLEPSGFIYLKDNKRINLKCSHHKNEMLIVGHDGGI